MYKAAYMFYFAPNVAAKHIAEIPKNAFQVIMFGENVENYI